MADMAADEWVTLKETEAENAALRERLVALEQRRADEQASFQRTFDKMLGEELRLKEELAKKPAADERVATALRQLATHVLTFVALYDPKMVEGEGEAARCLRDVRERARAVLEHAAPPAVPKIPEDKGPRATPAQALAIGAAKIAAKGGK
jgi:hypothetical protein